MCNKAELIKKLKEEFRSRFAIKDLGEAEFILGIQIEKLINGIWIGQKRYAQDILEDTGFWITIEGEEVPIDTKDTPMAVSWRHDDNSPLLNAKQKQKYMSILMKLMYLASQTRPDLTYSVNVLTSYMQEPRQCDWKALERILRYLRGTYDFGLFYQRSKLPVTLFTSEPNIIDNTTGLIPEIHADASYAEEKDRKSRSGYLSILSGAAVTWASKKQSVVAQSSTEAEYYALAEAVKESIWIKNLLSELNILVSEPIIINQDNQSTMAIATNPIQHQRVKHMDVRVHFIREHIEKKGIALVYCPTELMIADALTKALPAATHQRLIGLMGMRSLADLQGQSPYPATELIHLDK
jgi:hypothetical protein